MKVSSQKRLFSGLFSYVFQTLVVGGIVVTNDVVAVVEGVGDVGRGIDNLIVVGRVAAEGLYQRLLEMLGALLFYSLVLHVVCKNEAWVAHLGKLQRSEEDGETSHELQEEGGGGTELVVAGVKIGDVLREIDVEVFLTGFLEGSLAHEVRTKEVDAKLLHRRYYIGAMFLLTEFVSIDVVFCLVDIRLQLVDATDDGLVVSGGFEQGLVLQ